MVKIWKVILAAVVIFAAGAVTGGLAVRFKSRPSQPPQRSSYGGHRSRGDLADRMQRDLKLTQEQRQSVEQILRESNEQMKQIWESIAPRVQEEQGKVCERIRSQLNPAQCAKFEDVFKRPGFRSGDSKFRDGKRSADKERPEK